MDSYTQQRIDAAFLTACPQQAAYDWLYNHRFTEEHSPTLFAPPAILEYLLIRRRDPLIDLGIAQYGNSDPAIRRAFMRGNIGVRCAALSNPRIGPGGDFGGGWLIEGDIKELVQNGSYTELISLTTNEHLENGSLVWLIKKIGEFSELSDDQHIKLLYWLAKNPRMNTAFDDSVYDGWAEHEHGTVFNAAWDLAREMPTTQQNARVLEALLQKTQIPIGYTNPEEVIERWRIDKETEEGKEPYDASYYLRSRIADTLKADKELLQSDDLALRRSFFRRFSPWEFKDWPSFIEKDGEPAYDSMIENDHLWKDIETRRKLRDLAWDVPDPHSSMMAPNTFNAVESRKQRENPEWFKDEYDEYSNEPNAVIRRIDQKIDKLNDAIEALQEHNNENNDHPTTKDVQEMTDNLEHLLQQSGDYNSNYHYEIKDKVDALRESLTALRRLAERPPPENPNPVWPWVAVVIILLVYIFVKR